MMFLMLDDGVVGVLDDGVVVNIFGSVFLISFCIRGFLPF